MKNFYLTIVLFLISVNVLKAELPQSEKNALLIIAESLHFPSNWNADIPFEQWSGITISSVNGNDHVTEFVINRNISNSTENIEFSSQIQHLTQLKKIHVGFIGSSNTEIIFDFQHISNLNYLEDLAISFNYNFPNSLVLNINKLTEISNLKKLRLFYNKAGFELPSNISDLTNLKSLSYSNAHEIFPNHIHTILGLESLSVSYKVVNNQYPSYVENLTDLIHLKSIGISSSHPEIPEVFFNLPAIESLSISQSEIIIPDYIINYQNQLKNLSLNSSSIYFGSNFGTLSSLESLSITGSTSNGSLIALPDHIQYLNSLKNITIVSYFVLIPNSIKNLQNLEELILYNGSTVFFDNGMYEIPNLKMFLASYQEELPEAIGNFPNIEHIQVTINNANSTLPESLGNLSTLKKLDIFMEYSGVITVPQNIFNWPNLEQLWIKGAIDLDITNKFLNSPNLKKIFLENYTNNFGNLRGTLNLCQNPLIDYVVINKSNIGSVDLRNNQIMTNGVVNGFYFTNNPITNFYVDDVNVFQNLIDVNKVRINDNTQNYQISTSAEPCARVLGNTEITQNNKSKIFPNPVKDFIQFEADKTISDVEITNMAGQKFNLDVVFDNKVNASYLPKGVYVIKYKANGVYYLDKFIKN